MIVFRICNTLYANDLYGIGSKLYGGRWNNKGNAVLYTSSTRALAALEILVHMQANNIKPIDFSLVTLSIPETSTNEIKYATVKDELDMHGFNADFKSIGDDWLKSNKSLLLKIPSVIIVEEFNYLINPLHKDFHKTKIEEIKPFHFDNRLLVK